MARPAGTYVSKVFNFGVDKNIPAGFVDVVFDRTGNAVGFEKDGKFYNLGEAVPAKTGAALNASQLSKKTLQLEKKIELLKTQARSANASPAQRKTYVEDYRKTSAELSKAQQDLLEAEVREGKVKEKQASTRAANIIRQEIRALDERKKFLIDLGESTTQVENELRTKRFELESITSPKPIKYQKPVSGEIMGGQSQQGVQPSQVAMGTRPFGGATIPGLKGPTGPIKGGQKVPTGTGAAGATGGAGAGAAGAGTGAGAGASAGAGAGATGGAGAGAGAEVDKLTPDQRYANAIAKAQELYNMPDIVFKNIDSLGRLLKRYVNKELTDEQFAREIQNDPWYRTNSKEIQARYVQLFNYQDLVKSGRAQGTTNYEQEIDRITRQIQAEARRLRGAEIDDADAKLIAKDLYIFNLDKDASVLRERIVRFIRPVAGMVAGKPTLDYGGEALQNYQALQALAKANGFRIEDILPKDASGKSMTAEGTLEQLALGKLDVNRLAQDVRKLAAVGQSDFVKDLLGQGYNLADIYAPYKQRMANILEVDQDKIDLRDPALQMAISKEGDMNLFDYERMLRKDNRWGYTKQARQEAVDAASTLLRNFGFQG